MKVKRLYVEKKSPYDHESSGLLSELRDLPGMESLKTVRVVNRYDVEGISDADFEKCVPVIFSEPPVDEIYYKLVVDEKSFAVESLPGQFDQRADSCAECVQLLCGGERPLVRTAKIYILAGEITDEQLRRVKDYVINPVEAREAEFEARETLVMPTEEPADVAMLEDFISLDRAALSERVRTLGLAMDIEDALCCQDYFRGENRAPSMTELRVIDTYWSDHCRHTTFNTIIDEVKFENETVVDAYERYLKIRKELGRENKPITLMEIATIGARKLKRDGLLPDLDESEEINACSVRVDADVDGKTEPWLLMFKNETHNHPTEIEPFGGAATCVGGAIRDPLSGRSYVFGSMRVTGAGDPTEPIENTLPNKLPQRKICTTAAAGFSSYGNQIGLATGLVDEMYHPGYKAKRLEIGAVLGAAPVENVRRERPAAGDVVVLLGGRTGRDGIGGATGSSKAHSAESLSSCGAEVQKGNAPVERKIQRLFRDPEAARLIKRCNDFGAGGVAVAIGELADGLEIDLDKVPKKYDGLDGTELAISESQERMAVVLAPEDVQKFLTKAAEENLEATVVAKVTDDARLMMSWRGKIICDIARKFLNTNGAEKHANAIIPLQWRGGAERRGGLARDSLQSGESLGNPALLKHMSSLNLCGKQGLVERFDSNIGAGTVLTPYGGKYQLTPAQALAMKLPVGSRGTETKTAAGMSYACDPYLTERDSYLGAYTAVCESVRKLIASGFSRKKMWLTFQEYFERLRNDPTRWGKPVATLLGALDAQLELGIAAIGGKDSMSGSFENLDVPPTLCSFAVGVAEVDNIISPEFKRAGSIISLIGDMNTVERLIAEKKIISCWACGAGGIAEGLCKMTFGNKIGVKVTNEINMFERYSGFVVETAETLKVSDGETLGVTTEEYAFENCGGEKTPMKEIYEAYASRLEKVYPFRETPSLRGGESLQTGEAPGNLGLFRHSAPRNDGQARPTALIPVFPGNNCEYDTARALERAGAKPETILIRNLKPADIEDSVIRLERAIKNCQMIVLPGGFSGGDEPDGAAKFIVSFFRNERIEAAVHELLNDRDGLMLGICNGFQALVKLGLVPFGKICGATAASPTLTYNTIGRFQGRLAHTRIVSRLSPWLSLCEPGDIHTSAVAHGEGRFVCGGELLQKLAAGGQIATRYVGADGSPAVCAPDNPNGSVWAIEGICSPDGRVLGKMLHPERAGVGNYKNVPGNFDQKLFEGGVSYFA